jgi:hypothetical protein
MGGVMSGSGALGFIIGIAGFVVMLGSATVALTAIRGQQHASAPPDPRTAMHPSRGFTVIEGGRPTRLRRSRRTAAGRSSGTFMERMEERWRRRREQGGF